ncbi:MAG: GAF domain-containing protein, partial [Solirubrobacteraceae bacterium]
MHRLAREAAAAPTPEALCEALTAAYAEALAADLVHVFEVAQDRAGGEATSSDGGGYGMALDGSPSGVARVVATGESHHVPDARESDAIRADNVERYSVASALFVPIAHDGEVRRVAILISHERREFAPEEIAEAEALAALAAAGLARLEA